MVDTISRDERYLFDLILKARRKAIALYLRFRKGQSVRDIWGSSAFPIVLSPNSAVQRLQCWSSSFRRSAAGISQSISTARSQTHRRGCDIAADLSNAISKALRDRLGHVPMFIFTVDNRFVRGKRRARLTITGT